MYKLRGLILTAVILVTFVYPNLAIAQKNTTYIPSLYKMMEGIEESEYETKYNDIKNLLINQLPENKYLNIEFYWITQNEVWLFGYIIGDNGQEKPSDIFNFLVKIDSVPYQAAYMYSNQFDEWLDQIPESIIEDQNKQYLYSAEKSERIATTSQSTLNDPQLSFPWREGFTWRLTSGPHHELGPDHNEKPWSGLDFGIPYGDDGTVIDKQVVLAQGGSILAIEPGCSVVVGFSGGWAIRYLHITNITASPNQSLERGAPIAEVDIDSPCKSATAPHLHIDLLKNGVAQDLNGKYIGGWQIKQGSMAYEGSLNLSILLKLNASTARSGVSASFIKNQGAIGSDWAKNLVKPEKHLDSVTLCNQDECYLANQGARLNSNAKDISKILLSKGYKVEFIASSSFASVSNTDAVPFSCLDFDVTNLGNYNFPETQIPIRSNSTEILIIKGECNPKDRPIKSETTTSTGTPTIPELPSNYECSNQTTGVKFLNNSGSCFYVSSGKSSLPFSPTKIEVIDLNRKYDITICNAKGQCDEFNNTANIDHSSVPRPFTRVEIVPQGLVSTDAIGTCKTSTGRKVEFATMQSGVKYYSDRNYTVKNVDKVELIGMRFLKTPNDDKMNSDPEYITCDIKKTTQVIIAIDGRTTTLSSWMRGMPYERINREIGTTDNEMQHFDLYACTQKAGYKLRLGGPQADSSSGTRTNYIIIFRDAATDKATDCSANFNVSPDTPILREISQETLIYSAPLLEWTMTDRNFSNDYLEAQVKIWKDNILISSNEWLRVGITQWVPLWNDTGTYKAQIVVRDSKGAENRSNIVTYSISPEIEACSLLQ